MDNDAGDNDDDRDACNAVMKMTSQARPIGIPLPALKHHGFAKIP